MKYAFIFASNVYICDQPTVSYLNNDSSTEFLRIVNYIPHKKHDQHHTTLAVDANISIEGNRAINIKSNAFDAPQPGYVLHNDSDKVLVSQSDGSVFFEVHQYAEKDYNALQTHILNEIEVQQPEAVFIVRGNFWVDGHHIIIDNEKLFVDEDTYATGVTNSHGGASLTPYGMSL